MYKPGDAYYSEFTTSSPSTGAATNADSLPVATANHNGTDDGTFALTVTNVDTGRYKITGTIPVGYAEGDDVSVSVAATVSSVAGKAITHQFNIGTKAGFALTVAPPTAAIIATTILQDLVSGSDFTTNGSLGKLLVTQLDTNINSRSTYAGTDTSGTTTLLGRITVAPPNAATIASTTAAAILANTSHLLATNSDGSIVIDPTQAVPTSNTAQTIGDALNAARAQGFGKWTLDANSKTLTLFAGDGTTIVRTFNLDSVSAPTTRT